MVKWFLIIFFFILSIGIVSAESSYQFVQQWGSSGYGAGPEQQFSSPRDIGVDHFNNVYVLDGGTMYKYTSSGILLKNFQRQKLTIFQTLLKIFKL